MASQSLWSKTETFPLNPHRPRMRWQPPTSSSPPQTWHRPLSHHIDLLHVWSLPRSPPTRYGAVSNWPALTHSLCLGASRIFSESPLPIPQSKRAITLLPLTAKLIVGTDPPSEGSSCAGLPQPVDCQRQETDTVTFTVRLLGAHH